MTGQSWKDHEVLGGKTGRSSSCETGKFLYIFVFVLDEQNSGVIHPSSLNFRSAPYRVRYELQIALVSLLPLPNSSGKFTPGRVIILQKSLTNLDFKRQTNSLLFPSFSLRSNA